MDMSRKLAIMVFCMVPAIIGGGIIYGFFHNYTPVVIWEILVAVFSLGFLSK
jgi:hypothetical protein